MSIYMTEAEQLENIKKVWDKIQRPVTIVLTVLLCFFSVYRYWTYHTDKVNHQASLTYEHMMVAFSNQDHQSLRAYANTLTQTYGGTIYADVARLTLAKYFVEHQQLSKARAQLDYVVAHGHMPAMRHVATLRKARLLFAEKSYQEALDALKTISTSTYLPLVKELKGDILAAMGQYQQALSFYKEAANEGQQRGIGNPFLDMKTNELVLQEQSSKADHSLSRVG